MRKWTVPTIAGLALLGLALLPACGPKSEELPPEATADVATPTNDPPVADGAGDAGVSNDAGGATDAPVAGGDAGTE